jgi:hypothetical protein
VRSKYGDAAVAIIEGTIPLYVRKTFTEVMADDGITDPDALKGFAKHEMQERSKQHSADRKLFNDNVKKIYDDILLHLSSASLLLVSQDAVAYSAAQADRDAAKLWTLVRTSHTVSNRMVSALELRTSKKRLEGLVQIQENGKTMLLTAYNKIWNTFHSESVKLGVQWTNSEIVILYLESVDNSEFRVQLSELLRDPAKLPKTIIDAQFWVADILIGVQQLACQDALRSEHKRKFAQVAHPITLPSDKDLQPCTFCEATHKGGADDCIYYKRYLKLNTAEIKDYVAKEKAKTPKGGKGGKGSKGGGSYRGRGRGRGSSSQRGRGRGQQSRGKGHKAHVTVTDEPTDESAASAVANWWDNQEL